MKAPQEAEPGARGRGATTGREGPSLSEGRLLVLCEECAQDKLIFESRYILCLRLAVTTCTGGCKELMKIVFVQRKPAEALAPG